MAEKYDARSTMLDLLFYDNIELSDSDVNEEDDGEEANYLTRC